MTVCGVEIGNPVTITSEYCCGDQLVGSFYVGDAAKFGMAVNVAGSILAVAYTEMSEIRVFNMLPTLDCLHVIGRKGIGPAEFGRIGRLCFTPDNLMLVCDHGNSRVQLLTLDGSMQRAFNVHRPVAIAVYGNVVAIGSSAGIIQLYSLATGDLIRRFGSAGAGPGELGGRASGFRFTPDGARLLVAEYSNYRLSLFTIDGVFLKHIGAGVVNNENKDVAFGAGGEIICIRS